MKPRAPGRGAPASLASQRTRPDAILVTCEHGGNQVPEAYRHLFAGAEDVLASHRGWDPGALALARQMARTLRTPFRYAEVTRLLVDLNRSPRHPRVFSERSRVLSRGEREGLLAERHGPHRDAVAADVAEQVARGRRVIHLGVHSFTPVLDGVMRRADVALLYDPARSGEAALCRAWFGELKSRLPELAVRRNQPYRGASDGLTTWVRSRFPDGAYLGVEIEVNQRLLGTRGRFPRRVGEALVAGLQGALVTLRG